MLLLLLISLLSPVFSSQYCGEMCSPLPASNCQENKFCHWVGDHCEFKGCSSMTQLPQQQGPPSSLTGHDCLTCIECIQYPCNMGGRIATICCNPSIPGNCNQYSCIPPVEP